MASWNEENDKDKESSHLKWKQLTGGEQGQTTSCFYYQENASLWMDC